MEASLLVLCGFLSAVLLIIFRIFLILLLMSFRFMTIFSVLASTAYDSSWVRNTSEQRISTLLLTTASVLAFPTFTEPPSTV
jgi:hypothetical protein